ncbi:MAG TPA: signal recognition particle protein, partial [Candidatus Krumholzibacteriaceae bacterium]|nr:signal recognition particle protein [Candidatus Krumholzibacteriaceae bacterium]
YKVVKELVKRVGERSLGRKVLDSLTPDQQIIKIVREELVRVLGGEVSSFHLSGAPACVMVCGLQGAGKTSFAAKLGASLKKKGRKTLLVAADIHRPAAVEQISVLAEQTGIPVYAPGVDIPAEQIAGDAVKKAKKELFDTLIVDTAGRLHIDREMMDELKAVKDVLKPTETLLVLDSMAGQEAVNVAGEFKREIDFSGIVLSKLDGDARGGAALSVKAVTGVPVKFVTVGEKVADLERFYPDRMAGRILGMGDILSLAEKAQDAMDEKKAEELERKFRKNAFTLEDFLDQLQGLKKMGSIEQLAAMVPGMKRGVSPEDIDENRIKRIEAIINSMTLEERRSAGIINGSRRKRIAEGSGSSPREVNSLLKQFAQMKKMVKRFSKLTKGGNPLGFPLN